MSVPTGQVTRSVANLSLKMKCDETRPSCRQCLRKGLVCGGYSRGFKWSYKHQPDRVGAAAGEVPRAAEAVQFGQGEVVQPDGQEVSETVPIDTASCLSDFVFGDGHDIPFSDEIDLPPASPVQLTHWPVAADMLRGDGYTALPRAGCSPAPSSELAQSPTSSLELVLHIPPAPSPEGGPDTPLRLIDSWFDTVCPAWSGFDSGMNMNRKLAVDLWHSSAAVFNSLQSMSASFFSARLPHMIRPAMNLLKTATVCIQFEVNALNGKTQLDSMPTGLLFSLFCLGTTVCWLDASRVGEPFLKEAKALLQRSPRQALSDRDQLEVLEFFEKSLVYWEMLVSVVGDTDWRQSTNNTTHCRQQPAPINDGATSTDTALHPWTGISSLTSRLFAQAIRLCRTYRHRITNPTGRAVSLSAAMQEIEESIKLEEQLLGLDFSSMNRVNETGDRKTPWSHLANVAEAYQIAALLQLYVTFPDLVSLRLPQETQHNPEGHVPWDKWIIPLTLRLVRVLEQVPPDSGSRVMQPLLYICASTGLRNNMSASANNGLYGLYPQAASGAPGPAGNGIDILEYVGQLDATEDRGPGPTCVPQAALDVGRAREFIMRRLDVLESSLQPKPIIVARELVKAIWAAYDNEPPGSTTVHWLDVMENRKLRSLFG